MAMEYFAAYHSYLRAMRNLTDEECGRLFRACLVYSSTGEDPKLTGNERYVFDAISSDIDRTRDYCQHKSDTNRKNVQKRWEKEKKCTGECNQVVDETDIPGCTPQDKVDVDKEIKEAGQSPQAASDLDEVINAWNRLGLSQIQRMNPKTDRYIMTKRRIKDYGQDAVLRAISMISKSDFLMGRATSFAATYDWFIRPNNFVKVLSGNYANHTTSGKRKDKTWTEIAEEMEADMKGD